MFGRGTHVWYAKDSSGTLRIVKTAWRSSTRKTSEADVYKAMQQRFKKVDDVYCKEFQSTYPEGIARISSGSDVRHSGAEAKRLSLRTLRGKDGIVTNDGEKDAYLHRVVLKTIGKPIWKFDSLKELAQAFLFVVNGKRVPAPFPHFYISNTDSVYNRSS